MTTRKNERGVITVLISLLLVGVLSLGTLAIEAGRLQAAKTQLAEANISAATSMIASYDSDLYARYGLLAIDTKRFTPERAADYLNFNADQAIGYKGNRLATLYLTDSVELTGIYNLTYPNVLKRQVLSRAKYRIVPQNHTLNVHTMDAFFADFQTKCRYVADKISPAADNRASLGSLDDIPVEARGALTALYTTFSGTKAYDEACAVTLSSSSVAKLPSTTGTVVKDAPSEDITDINTVLHGATTILGGSGAALSYQNGTPTHEINCNVPADFMANIHNQLKDVSTCSDVRSYTRSLARTIRDLANGFSAAINVLSAQKEENILLNSYIVEYFSNRDNKISTYAAPAKGTVINGSMENATFASACVEYVFGGNASERRNQETAYSYVQAIRFINNLYALMTAHGTYGPYSMHNVAAHIACANYESILDVELMTTYHTPVPFNKRNMILPINSPATVIGAFAEQNTATALTKLGIYNGSEFSVPGSNAFSYTESLAFGLWFVRNDQKLLRMADLIQLEMRYRQQHVDRRTATFLMSEQNTYCRIKTTGKFVPALPVLAADSGDSMKGFAFQSIKYAGY